MCERHQICAFKSQHRSHAGATLGTGGCCTGWFCSGSGGAGVLERWRPRPAARMLLPGRSATRVLDPRCLIFSCVAALLLLGGGAGAQGAAGTSMLVSVQPVGNTIKGRPMDVQPVVILELSDGSPDVINAGSVTAMLGLNPTASQLRKPTSKLTKFRLTSRDAQPSCARPNHLTGFSLSVSLDGPASTPTTECHRPQRPAPPWGLPTPHISLSPPSLFPCAHRINCILAEAMCS